MVFSTALEKFKVIRTSPGYALSVNVRLDQSAPTGDYYVQVTDKAGDPAGATAADFLCQAQKIQHVLGADDFLDLDFTEAELHGKVGVTVALSTTEFTYTVVGGNYGSFQGVPV